MSDKPKIRLIKQADRETTPSLVSSLEEKRRERERRAEITLLEILIERYPDSARRFVRKLAA